MGTRPPLYISWERKKKVGEREMVHCGSRPLSSSSPWIQLSIFSVMSSLFHSHFTLFTSSLTSICSLTPSFLSFLRLARTCSRCLPLHLRDVWCITMYRASRSAHTDPYKSVAAYSHPEFSWNRMFGCSLVIRHPLHTRPFLHAPATQHHLTGRENTVLTNMEMAASCMDRARQGGRHIVHAAFYWVWREGRGMGRPWKRGGVHVAPKKKRVFEAI